MAENPFSAILDALQFGANLNRHILLIDWRVIYNLEWLILII